MIFLFALLVLVSLPARAQHSVSLRWNASSPAGCPTSGAALSYTVYRVSAYGGSWQAIATGLTSLNYVDSTVQSGSAYYYAAAAVCTCSGTSCPNGSGGYYVGSSESQESDPSLWAYALTLQARAPIQAKTSAPPIRLRAPWPIDVTRARA